MKTQYRYDLYYYHISQSVIVAHQVLKKADWFLPELLHDKLRHKEIKSNCFKSKNTDSTLRIV